MKWNYLASLLLLAVFTTLSCQKSTDLPAKDNEKEPDPPAKLQTQPKYDNTSFGIYKGVITGSSGILIISVFNGDSLVKGYLTIDQKKDTLLTSQTLVQGQSIVNLPLAGKFSSLLFSANADGSNARISDLKIDGHPNATALVVHENSTSPVGLYEGTFSGELSGTVNFVKTGADDRSEQVEYLAKFTMDGFTVHGIGIADTLPTHTHQLMTLRYPFRDFSGAVKFDSTQVSGNWISFDTIQGLKRGVLVARRTY